MFKQNFTQSAILFRCTRCNTHKVQVAGLGGGMLRQHIRQTACHSRSKINSRGPQHQHHAAGHVFAAMIAHTFHHSQSAAIAYGKTLSGSPRDIKLARCRAVKNRVSRKNIASQGSTRAAVNRDGPAAQSLADVIIGFTLKLEAHSRSEKCSKTLPRHAVEAQL